MKRYWTDDASRMGNKAMSQVSSPAGGLWCQLPAAREQIPHEVWVLQPPPYPTCAGSWCGGCQAAWWRSSWYLHVQQRYLASGSWGWRCPKRAVLPSLGAGQCPAVPSRLGIPPSALETEAWGQERPTEMGSSTRSKPAMCLLHGANTWRTLRLPFMRLNLVLLYFHACRRRKKEGYLLSVHSQALKSWG